LPRLTTWNRGAVAAGGPARGYIRPLVRPRLRPSNAARPRAKGLSRGPAGAQRPQEGCDERRMRPEGFLAQGLGVGLELPPAVSYTRRVLADLAPAISRRAVVIERATWGSPHHECASNPKWPRFAVR
jgi:hypothetical protein